MSSEIEDDLQRCARDHPPDYISFYATVVAQLNAAVNPAVLVGDIARLLRVRSETLLRLDATENLDEMDATESREALQGFVEFKLLLGTLEKLPPSWSAVAEAEAFGPPE
jgi:hypothetical protein